MSIFETKSFNDSVQRSYDEYNDNDLADVISLKKYKFIIKRTLMHLARGTSPSPFAFKYQSDDERKEVSEYITYLMSDEFDEETKFNYDNDVKISSVFGYDRYKEFCSVNTMLLTFHFIKSKRLEESVKSD